MDKTIANVRAVLTSTPGRWLLLVDHLPDDLLERPPAPGEWSALACLRHLINAETRLYPVRMGAFLEGRDFEAFDPAEGQDKAEQTPRQLAEEFARRRAENIALLDTLSPSDLARTANHPALGQVTLAQMLNSWAAHDLMHTRQAEQAILQPFAEGFGPWDRFFTGHFIPGSE